MAEEFRGGLCGGMWRNPPHNLFSGGGSGGLSSPCLAAQPDMASFWWQNDVLKGKLNILNLDKNYSNAIGDDNSLVISTNINSDLDILEDNTQWNHSNLFCNGEDSEVNFDSILATDSPTSMNSSALYSIQPLLDDNIHESQPDQASIMSRLIDQQYLEAMGADDFLSACSWSKPSAKCSVLDDKQCSIMTAQTNVQSNFSNSIQPDKVNDAEVGDYLNNNMDEQPSSKRPRIETPSPLPTFKVRKEKIGDRITALQQLVSPFGKTDTASVLNEAIDYIKFLHEQVNVLSTPYLKKEATIQRLHEDMINTLRNKEDQDFRSRGLCLVPISSTYPIAQEDFWTPTFGGMPFR